MKFLLTLALLLLPGVLLHARQVDVTTASQINTGSWSPGDTLVLKNGTWTNQVISLRAFGTQLNPIVLMAETPGEVVMNGSSRVSVSGQYIEVSGLYFKEGTLSGSPVFEFRTSSSNLAENCRMTNCAIVDYNPPLNTTDSKWVSIYGKKNRVDHCFFENKNNSGTLLVVWLTSSITPEHIIENNHFGYRISNLDSGGKELNGQEIIRIGDSSTSMQYANVMVRNNYFEHCDGEIEIISNKSCGNVYSNNVFFACKGTLTLRHGNDCTVEGNYFFGNKVPTTGGVRIIGEDHKVYNNYFQDLTGMNFEAALCMARGKENSALNEYFQVKNAQVMFNTFVNCSQSFCINYNSSVTLPPITSVVAHNHIYNESSTYTNVNVAIKQPELDVTWRNNIMNTGKYNNFPFTAAEIVIGKNAMMELVQTSIPMFEPVAGTALSDYTTAEFELVQQDIRGRERSLQSKLPGASELNTATGRVMPDTNNTGVSYLNKTTALTTPTTSATIPVQVSNSRDQIRLKSTQAGKLSVYDALGKMMGRLHMQAGSLYERRYGKGMFLLCFVSDEGEEYKWKILI